MQIFTFDYETYYDDEYSLRKMTPVEYILDPRFEVTGLAVKPLGQPTFFLEAHEIAPFLATLDPKNTVLISHNALFDMCITVWIYGFDPRLMIDTLGVCRALIAAFVRSLSLASCADYLGLPAKGDTIKSVKGMNAAMIKAAGLWPSYVAYACNDAELCEGIYLLLVQSGKFPVNELFIMDQVIRMTTHPKFVLDQHLLAEHLAQVRAEKDQMLAQAMLLGATSSKTLASSEQFANLLRQHGVEPPTKTSPVTGKVTYAFAKSDVEFLKLKEHENPSVQILVSARLGEKSTLEESRTERLLKIAQLNWPPAVNGGGQLGLMPMPVKYSGAHTHRLSGDWSLNVQNFGRGSKVRHSLKAPPGHEVVTCDAAQIEARLVAFLCGVETLLAQFENGDDTYAIFASGVFGYPVNKKEHPTERFVGKQAILGLGFGLGWSTFQDRLKTDSKNQTGTMISLSDEDAKRVVDTYRADFCEVPIMWRLLNDTGIPILADGRGDLCVGPCIFEKGSILLPTGLRLFYHNLHYRKDDGEWWFEYNGVPKKLYGGKLLENIVQALDRCIVMDAALRIRQRVAALRLAQQAHDENGYVVPTEAVPYVKKIVKEEMEWRPAWAQRLPLKAEESSGASYGDAK
jgi:hypothetical protein